MGSKKKVVILGAGFSGIAVLKELSRSAKLQLADVTIVDKNDGQLYTPLLYEVATAYAERENLGTTPAIASAVVLPLKDIAKYYHSAFVKGEVKKVDWEKQIVSLADGKTLAYDYLIVALGSESSHFGLPGVKDFAYPLKSLHDAERIRQRVHDLLYKTEKQPGRLLRIVLAGGGPSGVELASELVMLLKKHVEAGHLEKESVSITLVEGKPRILSMLQPHVSAWALERLRDLGVIVHRDACIKEAKLGEVTITPRPLRDGEKKEDLVCDFRHEAEITLQAEMFIWTAGVKGSSSIAETGLTTDKGGRVVLDPSLEVKERKNVFVIGDAVVAMNPKTNEPISWTAQGAMTEGQAVGRLIRRRIAGSNETLSVPFKKYATVVTVGGKWAVVDMGPISFRGFPGWVARKVADFDYFFQVLPLGKAIQTWWRGLILFGKNDH
jgi:NADH dehydrogenase